MIIDSFWCADFNKWFCLFSEDLQQQAGVFKKNAHDLKKRMWWKNLKMKLILGGVIIVIIGVIALVIWIATKPDDE